MPPLSRLAARRDHLVVCGDDTLAARVIEELTTTYGEEGVLTALVAWYASAAGVANGVAGRTILPVGQPFVKQAA